MITMNYKYNCSFTDLETLVYPMNMNYDVLVKEVRKLQLRVVLVTSRIKSKTIKIPLPAQHSDNHF